MSIIIQTPFFVSVCSCLFWSGKMWNAQHPLMTECPLCRMCSGAKTAKFLILDSPRFKIEIRWRLINIPKEIVYSTVLEIYERFCLISLRQLFPPRAKPDRKAQIMRLLQPSGRLFSRQSLTVNGVNCDGSEKYHSSAFGSDTFQQFKKTTTRSLSLWKCEVFNILLTHDTPSSPPRSPGQCCFCWCEPFCACECWEGGGDVRYLCCLLCFSPEQMNWRHAISPKAQTGRARTCAVSGPWEWAEVGRRFVTCPSPLPYTPSFQWLMSHVTEGSYHSVVRTHLQSNLI